jgi:hypothetical protein
MTWQIDMSQPLHFLQAQWRIAQGRMRTWRVPQGVFIAPEHAATAGASPLALVPDHGSALLAWRDWAQAHVGERCVVGLSSRWLLHTLVTQPEGQRFTAAQASEAAAQQWSHYMGLNSAELAEQWLLRPSAVPGGWLVAASPRALVGDLLAVAHSHHLQVVWMGPWWAHGLQAWVKQAAKGVRTLAMSEPDWAVAAQGNGGELQGLWAQPSLNAEAHDAVRVPSALGLQHGPSLVWADEATAELVRGTPTAWGAPA